jgi:hypothetical protein
MTISVPNEVAAQAKLVARQDEKMELLSTKKLTLKSGKRR